MDTIDYAAELNNVTVVFGARRVLGPLDWQVGFAQHWGLLGPNGSGKTTLLGILGAQRHPTSGSAVVLGARIGKTDLRALRRRIGVVGHGVADLLPPHSSALEIVLTGKDGLFAPWWATFDAKDRSRAKSLLEELHCGHLVDQAYGRCSQGERQRILLARSLFFEHRLLLLDEPATGVDLPGREALISGLESLATRRGSDLASVHVVHTLEELPRSITHTLLVREGFVVASGPVSEVLTSESLSECYGQAFTVSERDGRYGATARGSW